MSCPIENRKLQERAAKYQQCAAMLTAYHVHTAQENTRYFKQINAQLDIFGNSLGRHSKEIEDASLGLSFLIQDLFEKTIAIGAFDKETNPEEKIKEHLFKIALKADPLTATDENLDTISKVLSSFLRTLKIKRLEERFPKLIGFSEYFTTPAPQSPSPSNLNGAPAAYAGPNSQIFLGPQAACSNLSLQRHRGFSMAACAGLNPRKTTAYPAACIPQYYDPQLPRQNHDGDDDYEEIAKMELAARNQGKIEISEMHRLSDRLGVLIAIYAKSQGIYVLSDENIDFLIDLEDRIPKSEGLSGICSLYLSCRCKETSYAIPLNDSDVERTFKGTAESYKTNPIFSQGEHAPDLRKMITYLLLELKKQNISYPKGDASEDLYLQEFKIPLPEIRADGNLFKLFGLEAVFEKNKQAIFSKLRERGLSDGDCHYLLSLIPVVVPKGHRPELLTIPEPSAADVAFKNSLQSLKTQDSRFPLFPTDGTLPKEFYYHHIRTSVRLTGKVCLDGLVGALRDGFSTLFSSINNWAGDGIYLTSEVYSESDDHQQQYGSSKLIVEMDAFKPEEILYIADPKKWMEERENEYFAPRHLDSICKTELKIQERLLARKLIQAALIQKGIKAIVFKWWSYDDHAISILMPHRLTLRGISIPDSDIVKEFLSQNGLTQDTPVPGLKPRAVLDTTRSPEDCKLMNSLIDRKERGAIEWEKLTGKPAPALEPFNKR